MTHFDGLRLGLGIIRSLTAKYFAGLGMALIFFLAERQINLEKVQEFWSFASSVTG